MGLVMPQVTVTWGTDQVCDARGEPYPPPAPGPLYLAHGVGGCIHGLVWSARGFRGVAQHGCRNGTMLPDPTKIPSMVAEQIPQ